MVSFDIVAKLINVVKAVGFGNRSKCKACCDYDDKKLDIFKDGFHEVTSGKRVYDL
jgi:hypothetical protein